MIIQFFTESIIRRRGDVCDSSERGKKEKENNTQQQRERQLVILLLYIKGTETRLKVSK